MNAPALSGVIPILVIPVLENDRLDEDGLCRQVDFLVGNGISAFGFGFGSEVQRLTEAERDEVLRVVVAHAAGRALVVGNVLAGSTRAAAERALRAQELGADAIMIPPPANGAYGDDDLFEHYAAIGKAASLPIVVQDAPGGELGPELLGRLGRELDAVAAIKVESPPTPSKVEQVVGLVGGQATILGGGGGIEFFNELERGANGTMPGPAVPDLFLRVWELHRNRDRAGARRAFERLLPLIALGLRSYDAFLYTQKEILRRRGVLASARLRAPSPPPDPRLVDELDALVAELELAGPLEFEPAG